MSLPVSQLDVVNQALLELGSLPVSNVNDQNSSVILNAKINILFPLLLNRTTWNLAVAYRTDNTPITVNFSPLYTYTYQLPSDYGRMYKTVDYSSPFDFEIVSDNLIQTNVKPFSYYYIKNSSGVSINEITQEFYRALALWAAADCCMAITNNQNLTVYLEKKYLDAFMNATRLNDMERSIQQMPYNDFNRQQYI